VALWLGLDHLVAYLLCVALLGGTLALAFLALRSHPLPVPICTHRWAVRLHDRRTGIPYGLALAAGALVLYPHTQWFIRPLG
jgi:prepilin peptidase CpaA